MSALACDRCDRSLLADEDVRYEVKTEAMRLGLALLLSFPALALAQDFVDVAPTRGLPEGFFARNVFCDVDGDGWPDLLLDKTRLFRNVARPGGGRQFVEVPDALGLGDGPKPELVLLADLDDDGDRDAFVGYGGDPGNPKWTDPGARSRIFLQEDGRFRAQESPELVVVETLVAGAWLDYDRDGHLDLIRGAHYKAGGLELEAYPLHLYRGLGGGRFVEVTDKAGLTLRREPGHVDSRRPVYGIATADWNGDGWPDVLVCGYGRQRNLLFANQRDGTFKDVGLATGFAGDDDVSGTYPEATKRMFRERYKVERRDEQPFRANGNTFDAPVADFDNDGDFDVFLGEITHAWAGPSSDLSALLVNGGPPTFAFTRTTHVAVREHKISNWNQGDLYAGWLDYDNDGLLDLLVASGEYPDDQRLRLFRQGPIGSFTDVTRAVGIDWDMCTQLTLADYDRDGDLDILVGNSNNRLPKERRKDRVLRVALFENTVGQDNHWINVRLEGLGAARGGSNRDAIGARITVRVGDWQATREISGGRGHAGHNDALEAAFGLGRRTRIDTLSVHWPGPGDRVTKLHDVEVDRFLLIREDGSPPVRRGPF
jgi:hypothetical protein